MDVLDVVVNHEINHSRFKSIESCGLFNEDGLGIFHMNIRSMNANFNQFLCQFDTIKTSVNVLVLTETGFDPKKRDFCHDIDGFKSFYCKNTGNKNGGIVVYISNNITVVDSVEIQSINTCNHLKIHCIIQHIKYEFICVYRSPSNRNIENFINDLEILINHNNSNNTSVTCLLGDININLLDEDNDEVNSYLNTLSQYNFISYINTITREQGDSKTCIDHFFCSGLDPSSIHSCVIETRQTDHYSQYIKIKNDLETIKDNRDFTIEIIDYTKLNSTLVYYNWDTVITNNDVNTATEKFIEILKKEIINCKSIKKISKKLKPLKPWMDIELIKCIRTRDKLAKKTKKYPDNILLKEHYIKYKKIKSLKLKNLGMIIKLEN